MRESRGRNEEFSICAAIIHYGDPTLTRKTLQSMLLVADDLQSVLIVDNQGNFDDRLDPAGNVVRLACSHNLGYAGGINLAAERAASAGATHLWVVNNDIILVPERFKPWVTAAQECPDADIYGSYVLTEDMSCWFGGGRFDPRTGSASHRRFGVPASDLPQGGIESTDWINGCSMLISVEAIARRGGFDEFLFLYKEELEWQVRHPRAKAILVREALVIHGVGQTTGSTENRLGRVFMARNGLILALRQKGLRRLSWIGTCALLSVIYPLLRGRIGSVVHNVTGFLLCRTPPQGVLQRM